MRVVRALFRDEAASSSRGDNQFLKFVQFCRHIHSRKENASAIEEPDAFDPDGNVRRADFAAGRHSAVASLGRSLAKELERNMPGFWRCPAKVVAGCAQAAGDPFQ